MSVQIGGRDYVQDCLTTAESVTIEIPHHGILRVLHPPHPGVPDQFSLRAVATAARDGHGFRLSLLRAEDDSFAGSSALLPGHYSVELRWLFVDDPPATQLLEIEVQVGEVAVVDFGEDRP